jgi:Protein of unknown function (DUF3012)
MKVKNMIKKYSLICISLFLLNACSPKVGSPEWCEKIKEKDKGDVSINEAKDYAKHCIFK